MTKAVHVHALSSMGVGTHPNRTVARAWARVLFARIGPQRPQQPVDSRFLSVVLYRLGSPDASQWTCGMHSAGVRDRI